ncbi:MAG: hypothetical protein Q9M91_07035 [Candidatus Dojkabacteria bacterium]|nr:hypothetical protein [Candidatus Dojkabacteria bacterium]MDQ7021546.1 hypothetical protein [Candidatus Dojkabacteria bacterium]
MKLQYKLSIIGALIIFSMSMITQLASAYVGYYEQPVEESIVNIPSTVYRYRNNTLDSAHFYVLGESSVVRMSLI